MLVFESQAVTGAKQNWVNYVATLGRGVIQTQNVSEDHVWVHGSTAARVCIESMTPVTIGGPIR